MAKGICTSQSSILGIQPINMHKVYDYGSRWLVCQIDSLGEHGGLVVEHHSELRGSEFDPVYKQTVSMSIHSPYPLIAIQSVC